MATSPSTCASTSNPGSSMSGNYLDRSIMYDVAYLKHLLMDSTFVSYFNVYLNLPIFPRRITFIPTKEQFNIEPVLLRKYLHTHPGKLLVWLCGQRLPQFVSSHLYVHYKLCQAVCSDHHLLPSFEDLETKMNISSLTDIHGFYNFHHYLLDSEGRVLVNCWLAIERLHSLANDERAIFLEDMIDTYLYPDSPMSLPAAFRKSASQHITEICKGVRYVNRRNRGDCAYLQQLKDKLLQNNRLFKPLQEMLLDELRDYWLNRYLSHLRKEDEDNFNFPRKSSSLYNLLRTNTSNLVDIEQQSVAIDGLDCKTLPTSQNMRLCVDNGLGRTNQMVYSHELQMDVTQEEFKELLGPPEPELRIDRTMKNFVDRMERQCIENRLMAAQLSHHVHGTLTPVSLNKVQFNESVVATGTPSIQISSVTSFSTTVGTRTLSNTARRGSISNTARAGSFTFSTAAKAGSFSTTARAGTFSTTDRARSFSTTDREDSFRFSVFSRESTYPGGDSPLSQFHSAFDLEKQKFVQQIQHGRRPSGQVMPRPQKSVDWSRHAHSRVRETRIEAFLQEELELFMCCPCSLRDELYKENYCDALKQVYNETSLKEVDVNNFLEVSIASDFIGGEDFKNYLMQNPDQRPLYNYQLWTAIEQYSYRYSTCEEMTFCARGRAMQVIGFFSERENLTFNWTFNKS